MDPPAVDNQTDFFVHPQLMLDRDGEKLCAMVKATFELPATKGPLVLAPPDRTRGIRFADVPWAKKEVSSIAYPADVCLFKPATDVIVVGRAFAPGGQPAPSFDVRVEVGRIQKSLKVFGLRVWETGGAGLSAPGPIERIDMRYDYAWGGADDSDPAELLEEPRNPVGMGMTRSPATLTHQRAPSIEDPAHPIRSHKTRPPPAGIGPVGRHWEPRRRYAGTYDALWQELRAPLPPEDFDDRFNQCASAGMIADPPLTGGEPVRLLNLVPGGGATTFDLPRVDLEIGFIVRDRATEAFRPHLDTVLVDLLDVGPDAPVTVEMTWRASVRAPRRMKHARVVVRELEVPA